MCWESKSSWWMAPLPLLKLLFKGSSCSRRRREESVDGGEREDCGESLLFLGLGEVAVESTVFLEGVEGVICGQCVCVCVCV